MSYPDAYAHGVIDGKPLDYASIYALHECEAELGYSLTVLQGIGGAAASAGTHLLGRAVDLSPWDADHKLRVLKDKGFIGWHRPYIAGLWPEHLHFILVLNDRANTRGLAPSGFRQIAMYDNGRDGLTSDRPDPSYRATPRRAYHYPPVKEPKPVTVNNVTKARDAVVEAMHALDLAASLLDNLDPARVVARAQIDTLQTLKGQARTVLEALPKQ